MLVKGPQVTAVGGESVSQIQRSWIPLLWRHNEPGGVSNHQPHNCLLNRLFPSLRGATWRNKGRSAWNGSRFEHIYAPFTWRLLTFKGWNWKCHVIIVIKTDLSGFVVPMHSGLCEQYVKSLGLRPRDLTSCFARALVHWDNKPLQNRS